MRQRDKQAPQNAEETVRDIRRATRRHFSAEEKIRIVLDGLRGEDSIGDVHPRGALRLIAGVESLNGLVLIGWSASFTYLSMEQFWADKVHLGHHGLRPRHR